MSPRTQLGVGGREISARLAGSLRGLGAEQGGSWDCPGLRVRALGRSGEGGGKQRPLSFEAPSKEKCKPWWVIPVWSWRVREGRGQAERGHSTAPSLTCSSPPAPWAAAPCSGGQHLSPRSAVTSSKFLVISEQQFPIFHFAPTNCVRSPVKTIKDSPGGLLCIHCASWSSGSLKTRAGSSSRCPQSAGRAPLKCSAKNCGV